MTIKREDVDRRIVRLFGCPHPGAGFHLVHPGKILRDEFLTPIEISVYELANAINVPRSRANDIVLGSADNGRHCYALRPLLRHVA